ncbi:hypothetical protein J6590_043369 [Homalodisca vitripennis]|nr:hypothetical protein J6590_043369 [Homalodisca vitripennis]
MHLRHLYSGFFPTGHVSITTTKILGTTKTVNVTLYSCRFMDAHRKSLLDLLDCGHLNIELIHSITQGISLEMRIDSDDHKLSYECFSCNLNKCTRDTLLVVQTAPSSMKHGEGRVIRFPHSRRPTPLVTRPSTSRAKATPH